MKILKRLSHTIREHAQYSEPVMVLFGIFGLINYPLFYLYWRYFSYVGYDQLCLRIVSMLLCLPLALKNFWPQSLKSFVSFYWYLTVTYCLPFFGFYVFLQTPSSPDWALNIILGLFWLITILDWVSFFVVLPLGIASACIVYMIQGGVFYNSATNVLAITINIIFVIITSLLFLRKKDFSNQEKLRAMKMLGGSIAHELRTPLAAMTMDASFLAKFFPYYQDAYTKAKEAQLPIHVIEPREEKGMMDVPRNMETVSKNAQTMITMMLANLNEGIANRQAEVCSMKECVSEALKTYPFSSHERTLFHWQEEGEDFSFLGNKEFTKYVLFNLLKNSLYAISSVRKGEIFITIEPAQKAANGKVKGKNQLIFKDTGPGMPPSTLRHIFDRFYTKTTQGTGIGLSFCQSVIQGFGGEISCASQQGEYTTFTISLPVL